VAQDRQVVAFDDRGMGETNDPAGAYAFDQLADDTAGLTPPENASRLAEAVPGSWLVRFPGAGHGLMYQDPEGLARVVLAFLGVTSMPAAAGC
jgi:pimeloyl-ACP methyl ester carboxylesterase